LTTKITTKGRVTLPKAIMQHLNVSPGDRVVFKILKDGTVTVHPMLHILDLKDMLETGDIHLSDTEIAKRWQEPSE
jgi:AbrB family looped-hinge helix DNA binding protein